MSDSKATPMMERYREVKRQNPGSLLLFRMGDFYELFYEDAQTAAKTLGLTLTSRDKGSTNPVPMAGFPYHALEGYLQKLIRAGFRVAVCDQVEDPKKAKGLVKREVTQVVTPGTVTDAALLDPRENNFLASVAVPPRRVGHVSNVPVVEKSSTLETCSTVPSQARRVGLAWLELSTGRFVTTDVDAVNLPDELARLRPAECLLAEHADDAVRQVVTDSGALVTERPPWNFGADQCRRILLDHFGTQTLEGFDVDAQSPGVTAAGALLEYVQDTQKSSLSHITRLEPYRRDSNLIIDEATRRSLELTQTLREGRRDGSLLFVIDESVTPMGARLMADWLSNPLTDVDAINRRLDAVEELSRDALLCRDLRDALQEVYDLQRLTARIATRRASPRDLGCLARSLALLPKLKAKLAGRAAALLQELEAKLDLCAEVRADVETSLVDDPPLLTTEGGIIRAGCDARLDELRDLARGGKEWIAAYQAQEIQRTGITNLKVGFNKVFGYYLEVTASHQNKVPADYMRKQTLKNQERFITPELKEHEDKVLRAEEQAHSLEQDLFVELRERVAQTSVRLKTTAEVLAEVDVLTALAVLATNNAYCRPELTVEPVLDIRESRHPVLDRLQPSGEFVPNDVRIGGPQARIQIITGPNMAGKSTYIRQSALITILAQMGSFVPASEARIGIADRIFARVGASDELGKGQSTFMVEMTETARILNSATSRSLVILDEIGRGTSTYDGISLAWAVTEFLHDRVECRTLFATHYHELTEATTSLKHAANWNVAIREQEHGIVFLHKIVEGAADKSYGIHVAKLAGVPAGVIERAEVILATLEADHHDETGCPTIPARRIRESKQRQLALFGSAHHPLLDEIRELDLEHMTPVAALEKLHRLRQELK